MLYISQETTDKIKDKSNRLIEIYGLPDSGMSSAAIFILKALPGLGLYIGLKQNTVQLDLFKKYAGLDSDKIVCCLAESRDDVVDYIKTIGPLVDYIIIDDFAYYILHEPKKLIKNYISILYAKALETNSQIMLLNQLRFDVFNHLCMKRQNNTQVPLKTLYFDYLNSKIDLRIKVTRGKEDDNQNIYVNIGENNKTKPPIIKSGPLACF
mgnify:CR=1 FL=1